MILWVFIGVLVVSAVGAVLLFKMIDDADWDSYFEVVTGAVFGTVCVIIAIGMLVVIPLYAYNYESARHQANIINREYGTNYSTEEVLHADKVIDTVKHLNRSRIELNGDLLRNAVDK